MEMLAQVANDYYNGFFRSYPILKQKLSMEQGANLQGMMYEATVGGLQVFMGL